MRCSLSSVLVVSALAFGCSTESAETPGEMHALAADAPALGKADSTDKADRDCRLVLRDVSRLPAADGNGYATQCAGGACNWVFTGHVDVSRDAYPEGAEVRVLYRLEGDATWWEVPSTVTYDGRPGFFSHVFEISEHLIGPKATEADLAKARIELIPFIELADGTRIFDHNRKKGDFDVYAFGEAEYFSIGEEAVCQPVAGTLYFSDDWNESLGGALHSEGWLAVHFDLDRLPQCRGTHNGHPAWDIVGYVRFLPSGAVQSGSVRRLLTNYGVPTNDAVEQELQLKIPADTTGVELWFHNFSGAGSSCSAYDSNYGKNYSFEVLPSVEDPRCMDVESWTTIYGGQPSCTAYAVDEQYDANNCEFWVSGFGKGHEAHYGIPFDWLEAYLVTGPQDGSILGAGMLTRYTDPLDGKLHERFSLGKAVDAKTYKTGFTYLSTGTQGTPSYSYGVEELAFFLDVKRPSGKVVRLWQSRQGQNYDLSDGFGAGTTTSSIPYGNMQWAVDGAGIFDSREACQ